MKLAINGGKPVRTDPFPSQCNVGEEEENAAIAVIRSKKLTGYQGNKTNFLGGPQVKGLEHQWKTQFKTENAIPCNSATSGLHIACGAIGLKPGDEVIVTPYSMTCSATAPLLYGAVPIFADVCPLTFNLTVETVEPHVTSKTKAIIAVSLFGHPIDLSLRDCVFVIG